MIVSYKTGAEFLQDNQTYLQKNPYLSTFFTLDAPLLQEAGKINYALRCEQGETRLLALKVEPYNLLLFGEEACVPELLRFLSDATSCSMCRRMIINAGLRRVVIRNTKTEFTVVPVQDWIDQDDTLEL